MARIAGVNIPTNKRVIIGLTYIYGIGPTKAEQICLQLKIPAERRVNQLSDDEVLRIRELIDRDFQVEGDLRREIAMNIKRLMDLGLLPRPASPPRPAGSRPAHPHQRPHPQGQGGRDRRQEEGHPLMAKAATNTARPRRKERKNIISGVAHVLSTFNNTMITIGRRPRQRHRLVVVRQPGLQGQPQIDALRRPGRRRGRGQKSPRARHGDPRNRGLRPWVRPRKRAACSSGRRLQHHRDPRHDAHSPQWLPSAQAPPRLISDTQKKGGARNGAPT